MTEGIHAGVDGPAYVFGKRNLDFVPKPKYQAQASAGGRRQQASSDFTHEMTLEE